MYTSIHTTYVANFIETTEMAQQIQLFKLESSIFQMNKLLQIEYLWITNPTLHSFLPQAQTFRW